MSGWFASTARSTIIVYPMSPQLHHLPLLSSEAYETTTVCSPDSSSPTEWSSGYTLQHSHVVGGSTK
eukprot:14682896-Ditylum_brightwellii.AAC.1